jgi:hypothetical protein
MKFIVFCIVVLLACHVAYGQNQKQTQKIIRKVLAMTDKYNRTWESLNMTNVATFHSDKSFLYYRNMKLSDGSNEAFKKGTVDLFKGTKSWKLKESEPVVQVLSKNAAVISFTGVAELITLDNKILDIGTGAYTYVWNKIKGEWKLIHIHESAK